MRHVFKIIAFWILLGLPANAQIFRTPTLITPVFQSYTVATLPSAGRVGRVVIVSDALTAGSCTVGGGSAIAFCRDSGAAWVPLGDGGSGSAPADATYITQTASSGLSAEQALSGLSTGLMQVTTTTGVISSVTTSAGVSGLLSDETGSGGALVFASSPTITTPTIASFTNATHNHTNAAGGGQLSLTAAVSGILPGANGGTNNGFMDFTGPASSLKTFTLPNASSTILTTNAAVTVAQGGTGIASGTSGGVPYFSGSTTIASSGALTANLPVIGGGAGSAPSVGTRSGNTTAFVTTTGTQTSGDCVSIDANGNHVASGAACTGGTGAPTNATYITQTANGTLSNEQALDALSTGLVTVTNGTGVLTSVAAPSGAVVGTSDSQTLTNKTLTTPILGYYTVGTLPAAATAGRLAVVTDASTAGSCTSGGGSALSLCRDSGSAWQPVGDGTSGGGGAPTDATYITQTANGSLSNEQALGDLSTGIMKVTTSTGVISSLAIPLTGTNGGTANAFFEVSGPATSTKTFTFPNASSTVLTDNAAVTVAQGGTGITSGTSGGIPYYSGTSTIASSAALTANLPVIGGGAGTAPSVGTRSGNTTQYVTTTGTQTSGDCVKIDANGNHVAHGSACGGSGATTSQGTYASLPGTCTTGDIYLFTDSYYTSARCSATNTWSLFIGGYLATAPDDSQFSWVNQGSATKSTTNGGIYLEAPSNGSAQSLRLRAKSLPSQPYTLELVFIPLLFNLQYSQVMVGLRNSSNDDAALMLIGSDASTLNFGIFFWNSNTSGTQGTWITLQSGSLMPFPTVYLRIKDDNTNRIWYWSNDGQHWMLLHSVSRTASVTPDQFCIGMNPFSQTTGVTLISYKETQP